MIYRRMDRAVFIATLAILGVTVLISSINKLDSAYAKARPAADVSPARDTNLHVAEGKTHDRGEHKEDNVDHSNDHDAKNNARHDDHDDHDDHQDRKDDHSEGDDHDTKADHKNQGDRDDGVRMTKDQIKLFGIRTASVKAGTIAVTIERPAEIKFNQDHLAHVVPRVSGIAHKVAVAQGDTVEEGQVIAILDSRELADAKALYLAGVERRQLAQEEYDRQKELRDKKIASEKSFLSARTALAEARIALTTATQKLYALGYDKTALEKLTHDDSAALTKYVVRAPLSGVVVNRHLVRGEFVETEREEARVIFTIANVSSVWADIAIYPHDLSKVSSGQKVSIATTSGSRADGTIAFVTPDVSEKTRTATARVVLANGDLQFRPGQFVQAIIDVSGFDVAVRIPKSAIQSVDDKKVVFVADRDRFKPQPVRLGREDAGHVEVSGGLTAGDVVVVEGGFVLKSQLAKAKFDDGHNH